MRSRGFSDSIKSRDKEISYDSFYADDSAKFTDGHKTYRDFQFDSSSLNFPTLRTELCDTQGATGNPYENFQFGSPETSKDTAKSDRVSNEFRTNSEQHDAKDEFRCLLSGRFYK